YKVFAQVNIENCQGVAIINKTPEGFDVVETNGGTSNGEVDLQLILRPKTNYGEGRFPQGPGPGFLKPDQDPAAAKAKNQPDRDKMYRWPSDWDVYHYDPTSLTPVGNIVPAGPDIGLYKAMDGSLLKGGVPVKKNTGMNSPPGLLK
ncbi:MAG: hypothetical protein KKA07_00745, partial [Bacteroidetes bacterium]|nr:hypothetical protein [Bacteroidota bacterium]